MRIRLKVLPLAALFMVWGGSGFAAADPFDAEHLSTTPNMPRAATPVMVSQ
jgi:hypothetical protein